MYRTLEASGTGDGPAFDWDLGRVAAGTLSLLPYSGPPIAALLANVAAHRSVSI
jgi:hypothetical protein